MRSALRNGTRQLHDKVDVAFAGLDLARAADYARFLSISARVVPRYERALEAAGVERLLPDWPQRRRAPALLEDLARLGEPPPPAGPAPTGLDDADAAFGAAYALEGSRLGAGLLLRDVERSADPRVRFATSFLRHGQGAGLWRGFLGRLEARGTAPAAASRALAGACTVFEAYLAALGEQPARGG